MLELKDVHIQQGTFSLSGSLVVNRGDRLAIIGPSGAGKSTLLVAISGFVPCKGSVLMLGVDVSNFKTAKRPLSIIFQDNNLFPHMTVRQNVGLGVNPNLRLSSEDQTRVAKALDRVGLSEYMDRKPSDLSGGQQSRVALARVLVQRNPLILLDEPFAALGPALRDEMLDLVAELVNEIGATLLMVTHNPQDAVRIATGVIVVADGVVQPAIKTADFLASPPEALRDYLSS
jgi:thiamine transport system ATP-binding protein